jgi:Fic family protein
MPIKFEPNYIISSKILNCLILIEAAKQKILHLPLTPTVLSSLRETARLHTTHYSTMMEGNRLDPDQVEEVLKHHGHFPGRERDEHEVKGYYAALTQVEKWAAQGVSITEKMIQTLHALVMANGKGNAKPSAYRDGQNVILDGRTKAIVYMPPEAKDVKNLMTGMVNWINKNAEVPCPIIAGIAHYQFATIHPYYDGNGRTARLLTTLILHLGGYDLKGLYSLEEYYARNLGAYYEAISIGESHNYYMGRAEADITKWVEYFVEGMTVAFENVLKRMDEAKTQGSPDQSALIRKLDPKQRKVLELFQEFETITSRQIGELFGFKPRTSAALCASWVESGFLNMVDSSNKGRKYKLSAEYQKLIN